MLNLDTHILIHACIGDLTLPERHLLTADQWGISAIVLWEIAKLSQLGRIEIDMNTSEFSRLFARIHVWDLDIAIAKQSTKLDFVSDPADEIIAATSIVHNVPLVTRDRKIRKSRIVPLAGSSRHQ